MIGFVLISYFTKRLFTSQVLKELYQTKHDRRAVKKPNLTPETRPVKGKQAAIRPNLPLVSDAV